MEFAIRLGIVAAFFLAGFGFGLAAAAWRARRLAASPDLQRAVRAHHDRVESLRQARSEQQVQAGRAHERGRAGLH